MIYVECKLNRILIQTLGFSGVTHSAHKSGVCKSLVQRENSTGVVDEDPMGPQPPYLRETELVQQKNGIKLHFDRKRNNKLVILCPELEEWIRSSAKKEKIQLSNYDLPEDPLEFRHMANIKITQLQLLLHQLKKRKNKNLLTLIKFLKN